MTSANKTSREGIALAGCGEDQLTETPGRLEVDPMSLEN